MTRPLILAFALAFLAACATSPPAYGPAASAGASGYTETQIETDRYFVSFRAPGGADAALLEDYALLRAAELTLQNGRDWFWVDRRTLDEAASGGGPSLGVGIGGGNWGRSSGVSVGVGMSFPLGGAPRGQRARAVALEVRFGAGVKPDAANAYDAHSTAANIRGRLPTG